LKYYKRALEESTEIGMHPFSDEVLGIRIQVSAWLEKIGNYKSSIEVLEGLLSDCTRWVETMEQLVAEGKINAAGRLVKNLPPATADSQDASEKKTDDEPPETLWRTRERVLAKAVSISTKLGETYASEHVLNPEKSHEHLLWAVETALKEFARRRQEGTRPGEQSWLTPTETGGAMESLGNDYERKGQFHLAIPLFFQALRLCDSPCHRVTIMNNLAASFAQFPLYSPTAASDGSVVTPEALKQILDSSMPTSRQECLEAGLNWVRNAYQHGKDVKGEERTPECDEACAVALYNWGDIARMLGKPEMARKKYEQAIQMSNKMEFAEGVRNAQEGLKKLSATPSAS
jgi:tetratricopeptide (TPR) repeat protein